MVALIVLAHGSRHHAAPRGVDKLTAAAGVLLGVEARTAYLDLNEPLLADVAFELAEAGHERAIVVPLLFTRAFHAKVDAPAAVAEAAALSGMHLELTSGLGTSSDIAAILAQRVFADAPPAAEVALYSVGTSQARPNSSVAALAEQVAELTGRRVHATAATCGKSVQDVAVDCADLHVLPLFVTEGLLLDKVTKAIHQIAADTDTRLTVSAPLETALADIVAARYRTSVYVAA